MRELQITSREVGLRLDRFLEKYLREANKSFLYRMLRKKNITLNGKRAQGNERLAAGDVLRLYFAEDTLEKLRGERKTEQEETGSFPCRPLKILYEDEHVLLVNKPAGMLSQKAREADLSLCEYLIGYLLRTGQTDMEQLKVVKPSVCNRLDRGTSGIVCCGKTILGLQGLSALFADRTVKKYYQCLVLGTMREDRRLEGYLRKEEKTNTAYVRQGGPRSGDGPRGNEKEIITCCHPLDRRRIRFRGSDRTPQVTLLEAELITGRSHQIRAQLSSVGYPIIGDPKYGDPETNRLFLREFGVKGQLLHCGRVVFPKLEGSLEGLSERTFTAPLPSYFPFREQEDG